MGPRNKKQTIGVRGSKLLTGAGAGKAWVVTHRGCETLFWDGVETESAGYPVRANFRGPAHKPMSNCIYASDAPNSALTPNQFGTYREVGSFLRPSLFAPNVAPIIGGQVMLCGQCDRSQRLSDFSQRCPGRFYPDCPGWRMLDLHQKPWTAAYSTHRHST